jgi:acyl-CoA synthetase (AMP-forming)/AMP-acid ligase II
LYITGRKKDLIVVDGHNHYPTDIEASAMRGHIAVRPDRCVAFQTLDTGKPRLVMVAELDRGRLAGVPDATIVPHGDQKSPTPNLDQVVRAVRGRVGEDHGLRLDDVVLVTAGSVPLTSSGKIRRKAVREQYRDGSLSRLR